MTKSKYLCDCHRCTNKYTTHPKTGASGIWCKPIVDGLKAVRIVSGTSGKDFVFDCPYYTTEKKG